MDRNAIEETSFRLAIRIVNLRKYLVEAKREFVLSKQLLRSGTSIGANVAEAKQAQSRSDFISKLSIALKEANETAYWLKLLYRTDYLTEKEYDSISHDADEIIAILVSIIKTKKQHI